MKKIEIEFNNTTFDGRYQWFFFFILDLNDFLGKPILWVIGNYNTFKNFKINSARWSKKSSRYAFYEFLHCFGTKGGKI